MALTSTTKTTIYTCGEQGELAFDVTWLLAVASDGTPDTISFSRLQHSDGAEYVIVHGVTVAAAAPYSLECMPIHLVPGEVIYATSGSAVVAHPTHIHITGLKMARLPVPGK